MTMLCNGLVICPSGSDLVFARQTQDSNFRDIDSPNKSKERKDQEAYNSWGDIKRSSDVERWNVGVDAGRKG